MPDNQPNPTPKPSEDAPLSQPQPQGPSSERLSLLGEFVLYLRENKKWWLIPILVVIGLFALLCIIMVSNPALAPFIYTLF